MHVLWSSSTSCQSSEQTKSADVQAELHGWNLVVANFEKRKTKIIIHCLRSGHVYTASADSPQISSYDGSNTFKYICMAPCKLGSLYEHSLTEQF